PLVDPAENWAALQLRLWGDDETAAAALWQQWQQHPLSRKLGNGLRWLLPLGAGQGMARMSTPAPVLLTPPPQDLSNWPALLAEWQKAGFPLGLEIDGRVAALEPPPAADFYSLDATAARALPIRQLLRLRQTAPLLLHNVQTRTDFQWGCRNQCPLLDTVYLLTHGNASDKPDLTRMRLLKLLSLVAQDADTRVIEEVFRHEPKLSYSLMRLVNSAGVGARGKISNFGQAITLLGRRQLQRWLQLLIYANPNNSNQANPLLLQAALRGKLLELAAARLPDATPALCDEASMTGIFSLLDVLLNLSMAQILEQLPLEPPVSEALLQREGRLGPLLAAAEAMEHLDFTGAAALLESLGLDGSAWLEMQLQALDWVSQINLVD
ncbi:MAG: hypothetical protein RIR00_2476, partial [Pseudomonadota bacterium]